MSTKNYRNNGKARVLLNLLSDPAVIVDEKGLFLIVNDVFEEVTGLKRREIIGKPFLNLNIVTAESKAVLLENLKKRMQGVPVEPYEVYFTGKTGETMCVEVKGRKVTYAGKPANLVVFHDITRRKENMRRLKEYSERMEALVEKKVKEIKASEEQFRAISTCATDAIVAADSKGKIVYWNPAAERIFGYPQEEAIGKNVLNLVILTRRQSFKKMFLKIIRNNQLIQGQAIEFTALRKDGTKLPAELSVGLMKFKNKRCLLGIVRDITERKRMQSELAEYSMGLERLVEERTAELKQAQAKLIQSERMATIGELAGMVGHDLRNPLTAIKNAAYYLRVKQDSCSEDNRKKMFAIIESAIDHADKIINDLQEYSKEMRLELANCSPQSILKEALTMIQVPDRVKIIDNTNEEPIFRADKVKMVRVFINIIKNAIDAMPEGGTLRVKSTQINGNVKISFTDTGIGMPKETLSKLFSPLVTTKAQNMGFGLAICKRIMNAHQGQITVQSIEGKGTTVTVTMPTEPKPKTEKEEVWINVPEHLLSITET